MNSIWPITFFILAANSVNAFEADSGRINGENGWYVPKLDGSFEWYDLNETEARFAAAENSIDRGLSMTPVKFYLYTASNPKKSKKITATIKSIDASKFNPKNPTRFITHGWIQGSSAHMNKDIRDAWLSHGDFNIICVDWARARSEYTTAVMAVSRVGKKIANMIDFLAKNYGMPLNNLILIGHSLGAHVSGYAGKNVKSGRVHTIIGLDPALPLFHYNKPHKRLAATDAYYVESIHTNGGTLGFLKPIGKAAFYPNGGESQPGCPLDITGACSHNRCIDYYAEAVKRDNYGSYKCSNYQDAVANNCGNTFSPVRMGSTTNAYTVNGHFYVPVNKKSPYGVIS